METLLNFNQKIMMKNKIGGFMIYGVRIFRYSHRSITKHIEIALIVIVVNDIGYIKFF